MKIIYDPEVDALSIVLNETGVTTQELDNGITLEFDAQGHLAGIEVLDASLHYGENSVLREVILEGMTPRVELRQAA